MAKRGGSIQPLIVDWLRDRVGQTFYVKDLMADLPEGTVETSVRRCLTTDLTQKGFLIESVVRGSVYRYKGYDGNDAKMTASKLFEQIGVAKDGRLVLQCDDGTIFLAVEVG